MTEEAKKFISYLGRCCIAALRQGDLVAAQECAQCAAYIARKGRLV